MGKSFLLSIAIPLLIASFLFSDSNACRELERVALLKLKHSLTDPLDQLSSWKEGADCCMSWAGVSCHNGTGHVVRLKLNNMSLGGEISPSLIQLNHLRSIDLSNNDFGGTQIPEFIGSLTKMTYLNLSSANFGGNLPRQLGNLSSLKYLDLGSDDMVPDPGLETNSLAWISNLSNLRYLNMDEVNLMNATDWLLAINKLPSLSVLRLSSCEVDQIQDSLPFLNLTSLSVLDLSTNNINSTIPQWLLNVTGLTYLDLSGNSFSGSLPEEFGSMTSLAYLNLKLNQLVGEIPRSLGNLCRLQVLDLSFNELVGELTGLVGGLSRCYPNQASNLTQLSLAHNSLTGSIPSSLGKLTSLQFLYLESNKLRGTVPGGLGLLSELIILDISMNSLVGDLSEALFAKLGRLQELSMSLNFLTLKVSPNWVPPFQLIRIHMQSCQLGPRFPLWLQTQIGFYELDLSNTGIVDTLPDWFWNLTLEISYLNLSHNQIKGRLPGSLESISIQHLDLSSNNFTGPLPRFSSDIVELILYDNSFSGPLPSDIGQAMPVLMNLFLSSNFFYGSIPQSVCEMLALEVLGLSDNLLSGELPRCWNSSQTMVVLDFGNNMLSGSIPKSIGSMITLKSLHLNNNNLTGEIPRSLENCTGLVAIDVGENNLMGKIPSWLGESLSNLMLLRLRSNMFTGRIPPELSLLTSLQLLDIANNSLSGIIPQSFGNLTAMTAMHKDENLIYEIWGNYEDTMMVYMKGRELKYSTILALVTSMDFSSNKLFGEIPEELTRLSNLILLNLSNNRLTGRIPMGIGDIVLLESLDLSINELTGTIPPSISALTFLSHLNLSYNNLSGRIPSGFQLQTLDDPYYVYIGNEDLCGSPLTVKCITDGESPSNVEIGGNDEDGFDSIWLYSSIAPGFVVGSLVFWGVLVYKTSWKFALLRLFDDVYDWLYVIVALSMTKAGRSAIISRAMGRDQSMT